MCRWVNAWKSEWMNKKQRSSPWNLLIEAADSRSPVSSQSANTDLLDGLTATSPSLLLEALQDDLASAVPRFLALASTTRLWICQPAERVPTPGVSRHVCTPRLSLENNCLKKSPEILVLTKAPSSPAHLTACQSEQWQHQVIKKKRCLNL